MTLPTQKSWFAIFFLTEILCAPAAFGNAIQFDFGPSGAPSMTALFEDTGPNQVQLTITALALTGNNSLESLCFNFNPAFDARDLIFTQTGSNGGVHGSINTGNDSYKVTAGSGKFDIDLLFGSPTFLTRDVVSYSVAGISGLSVNDFLFLDTPSAGQPQTYAAASLQETSGVMIIQGTPEAVPDATSSLELLLAPLLIIGWLARHLRRIASI